MEEPANGYESVAKEFIEGRGTGGRIGVQTVLQWAKGLPAGAAVLDLGCGPGYPISKIFVDEGFSLSAIDASPTMIAAFHDRFPDIPCLCEPVETSNFFGRSFDAILAWGLIFLLKPDAQEALIRKIANTLKTGGAFLFTSPTPVQEWSDAMTGQKSVSLGCEAYRDLIGKSGLRLLEETSDEGHNHYYIGVKPGD